jgi:stage II sporulation protein D
MCCLKTHERRQSMKLFTSSIVSPLLLACAVQTSWAAPIPPPRSVELLHPSRIRVRLAEALPSVKIRGFDLRIFSQNKLAKTADRLSEWELRCQEGRIRAIEVGGAQSLDLKEPVSLHSLTGFLKFRDRPYREELQIHSVGSFCEVVNHVDVEKYLDGLVNSEFNAKWNEEAIGAQVVAARTYAYFQMRAARGDTDRHYDVDATVRDQVYDGSIREDFRASRSVERTRGLVLTVGSAPLKAFYHSTCGGVTELPEHVWGSSFSGFKHSVRCPFCVGSPVMSWQLDLRAADVMQAFVRGIENEGPKVAFAQGWPRGWKQALSHRKLVDIRAGRWDAEGRVSEVITIWKNGAAEQELRVSGAKFRDWIGPAKFRSAAFQVITHHEGVLSWHFQGRGNGHGVGMCQWGAKTMGEKGFKTASILKHYYPDAVLSKLW